MRSAHSVKFLFFLSFFVFLLAWITPSANPASPLSSSKQFLPLIHLAFTPPILDHLLITEIMAYPATGQVEWIELYNPTSAPIDLSGYKIGDEEIIGGAEAMRQFSPGAILQPNQVIVLATDANAFQTEYGFLPDYEIVNTGSPIPDLFDYVPWANGPFNLANTGDEILLLDFFDDAVDAVAWGDSSWLAFNPPALNPDQGKTLERFPAYLDTNTAPDWREQPEPNPGEVDLSPPPGPTPTPTPFEGGLLISEVLYNPIGTEPNAEWIELYNATGTTINLSDFKIGDEETSGEGEGMYQFPPGAAVAAGAIIVIANRAVDFSPNLPNYELINTDPAVPDMIKYTDWAGGSASLANTGDDILLLDYHDNIIDAVSWGVSIFACNPSVSTVMDGHSIERVPSDVDTNTSADWQGQSTPNPGDVHVDLPTPTPTMPPTPFIGFLLISEVLYDHMGTEPPGEWIEMHNATGSTVDLTNFKIGDEETQGEGEGMYRFPDGAIILNGEVIVIANQATAFFTTYGFNPDFELNDTDPTVPDMIKYTLWSSGNSNLANGGDELLLLDPDHNLVDAVSWGKSNWAFDPPVPGVVEGHSIERVPADMDTDTHTEWVDQSVPDPGNVDLGD